MFQTDGGGFQRVGTAVLQQDADTCGISGRKGYGGMVYGGQSGFIFRRDLGVTSHGVSSATVGPVDVVWYFSMYGTVQSGIVPELQRKGGIDEFRSPVDVVNG